MNYSHESPDVNVEKNRCIETYIQTHQANLIYLIHYLGEYIIFAYELFLGNRSEQKELQLLFEG